MKRINLGCATLTYAGWDNLDREIPPGFEHLIIKHDITTGLPYENDSVNLISCQHCFDHINPILDGIPLLSECYRVLIPGGIARFALMDFRKIVSHFPDDMDAFAVYQPDSYRVMKSPMLKLATFLMGDMGHKQSQGYHGHWGVLDFEAFKELCEDAGWVNIVEMSYGVSNNKIIQREVKDLYENHTMYVELVK